MLHRCLSLLASFFLLFSGLFPADEAPHTPELPAMETEPAAHPLRTADAVHTVGEGLFYIERPNDKLTIVQGKDFGMDSAKPDNFPALVAALNYCKSHPGTCLQLDGGTYYLNNTYALPLSGLENVLLDGQGAKLIFSNVTVGLEINGCDCVELRNIRFDWDWDKHPLSHVATVRNASKKTNAFDFVFPEDEEVDESMIFAAVTQCDPDTFTYGAPGSNKEIYVYQNPACIQSVTRTAPNVLHIVHNGSFHRFSNGETYIIRHYVYDTTFCVLNGESRNITFNGVSLYGYPGSGYYAGGMASHFQWLNCFIGAEPGTGHHTSLGADAIHIANSNGCFRIDGCDISGQGDDALNVHDGLGWVKSVAGAHITLEGSAILLRVGDTLRFRDRDYRETDITAVIQSLIYHPESTTYDLTFKEQPEGIVPGFIAYNTAYDSGNYAVTNNYFHENRARGLLMQSSFGLCEGNRFFKTQMQGIKIVMDIAPGLWYEGTGADSLVIRDNVFEQCDYVATGEVITIGSNIAGKSAVSQPFTNIAITDNTFTDFPEQVLNADNVNGLIFRDNTIRPKSPFAGRALFGAHCSHIQFTQNQWENSLLGPVAKATSLPVWARVNQK